MRLSSIPGANQKLRGSVAEPTLHGEDPWQAAEPPDVPERLLGSDLVDEIEFLAARARSLGSPTPTPCWPPLDLKVRSYSVLAMACSGTEPSQRELADFLRLDPSQIVSLSTR